MKKAEDYILEMDGESDGWHTRYSYSQVEKAMIEFAKFHVEKALKQVSCNITGKIENPKIGEYLITIDKDSVLNAYPLENIK